MAQRRTRFYTTTPPATALPRKPKSIVGNNGHASLKGLKLIQGKSEHL